jgi:hypothetical protein
MRKWEEEQYTLMSAPANMGKVIDTQAYVVSFRQPLYVQTG